MSNTPFWEKSVSRRKFLIGTGVAVGGTMLAVNSAHAENTIDTDPADEGPRNIDEGEEKVATICWMCGNNCGLQIVLNSDDDPIRVEPNPGHPGSAGKACARAHASIQQLKDPDRLKEPMRKVGENDWEAISWEEALDTIHSELQRVSEEYGPECVTFLRRRSSTALWNPFVNSYGSPNNEAAASICEAGKRVANTITAGANGIMCDFKNSKYIVLLGASQMEAPRWRLRHTKDILDAKENGGKLVVVDPRLSHTGAKADKFLPIKSGTDGILLMSIAQVLITEGRYDKEFVETYGQGFEEFKEEALKSEYDPANAEIETGIPADDIVELAREMSENTPAICDSSSGIHKFQSGTLNHWALMCVNGLLGSIEVPGGVNFLRGGSVSWPSVGENNVKKAPHYIEGGWGYGDSLHMENRALVTYAILNPLRYPAGPYSSYNEISLYSGQGFKAAFIYHTDPVVSHSNPEMVKKALQSLEFAVGIDIYLSSTLAHFPVGGIILPEATFMERWHAGAPRSFVPYVHICQPVTEPYHDSKSAHDIFKELGQRFGFEGFDELPDDKEFVRLAIENTQQADGTYIDWDEIVEKGYWVQDLGYEDESENENEEKEPQFGERERLHNGKFYFAMVEDEENELSGMQKGVKETSQATPYYLPPLPKTEEYPLRFMSGGKTLWHTQGATRNLPYLMQEFDENALLSDTNYVFINPETAAEYGINHGDKVRVSSPISYIEGPCRLSERISKEFVHVTHGFGHTSEKLTVAYSKGMNSGRLIDDMRFDYISGNFTTNEEICKVEPIQEEVV